MVPRIVPDFLRFFCKTEPYMLFLSYKHRYLSMYMISVPAGRLKSAAYSKLISYFHKVSVSHMGIFKNKSYSFKNFLSYIIINLIYKIRPAYKSQ